VSLSPNTTLLASTGAVGASTFFLYGVTGYGTILGQVVVLGAWAIVAAVTSGEFADLNDGFVWSVVLLLNIALFLVPAIALWLARRSRWPLAGSISIVIWCCFYISALFGFFPATDGP
jgi:hypothetical protein